MNECKSNTAKSRVKKLILSTGFEPKPKEKPDNLVERYLMHLQEESKATSKSLASVSSSNNECSELLKATIEELEISLNETEVLKKQVAELKNNNKSDLSKQSIELLMEASAGFSDGLHFRSFCYRTMKFIESVKDN